MSGDTASTALLIRATRLDDRVLEFADALAEASGYPVRFVLDERRGPASHHGRQVVGITDERCRALGLYCPLDYAWRCGDYGYYLARAELPGVTHFWMIEHDVRFGGDRMAEFFAFFAARPQVDLLAAGLEEAGWDWYWTLTTRSRSTRPFRCFFPVTRLSARAVDALSAKRVAQSSRPLRRLMWPNDEAMVATTLVDGGFHCRDLNDFGRTFYGAETFTFANLIDGDALVAEPGETRLLHPVLYGAQYEAKRARLTEMHAPQSAFARFQRRALAKLNSYTAW